MSNTRVFRISRMKVCYISTRLAGKESSLSTNSPGGSRDSASSGECCTSGPRAGGAGTVGSAVGRASATVVARWPIAYGVLCWRCWTLPPGPWTQPLLAPHCALTRRRSSRAPRSKQARRQLSTAIRHLGHLTPRTRRQRTQARHLPPPLSVAHTVIARMNSIRACLSCVSVLHA